MVSLSFNKENGKRREKVWYNCGPAGSEGSKVLSAEHLLIQVSV
jgi:hypothetical protein